MSTATLGVDYGWEPVAGEGIRFIIRIEPERLESLKNGFDVSSDLPPGKESIQSYRITTEPGVLPHQGEPLPQVARTQPTILPATQETRVAPLLGPAAPANPAATTFPPGSTTQLRPPFGPESASAPQNNTAGSWFDPQLRLAATNQPPTAVDPSKPGATFLSASTVTSDEKPWLPLAGALVALFISLGANGFLAVVNLELRERCRALTRQLHRVAFDE